jgi:hypothetical protein
MHRSRPFTAVALAAVLAMLAIAAPAAMARRTKEQHLLDRARVSAGDAARAFADYQALAGTDPATPAVARAALAARLDQLDVKLNLARADADRLSRRLAQRQTVVAARAKKRSSPSRRAADRTTARRLGRASTAAGQAAKALQDASGQVEQIAFDMRATPPGIVLPISPVGSIAPTIDDALTLLKKITVPSG